MVYRIPCRLGGLVVDSSDRPAMACTLTANSPVGWRFVRFYSGGNPQTTSTVYFPVGGEVTDLARQSVVGGMSIVNGLEDKAMIFARLKTSFIIPLAGRAR